MIHVEKKNPVVGTHTYTHSHTNKCTHTRTHKHTHQTLTGSSVPCSYKNLYKNLASYQWPALVRERWGGRVVSLFMERAGGGGV